MMSVRTAFRFDHRCKYFQEATSNDEALPMFRYKEVYDSSEFVADTFGDGSWIDRSLPSQCSSECACRRLAVSPEKEFFAFAVTKSQSSLKVRVHSLSLQVEILKTVAAKALREAPTADEVGVFDGFALVKYRQALRQRLNQRRQYIAIHSQDPVDTLNLRLLSEMHLLVNGLLCNMEIIQPFHPRGPFGSLHQQHDNVQHWASFSNAYLDLPCQLDVPRGPSTPYWPPELEDVDEEPRNTLCNSFTVCNDRGFMSNSHWDATGDEDHDDSNDSGDENYWDGSDDDNDCYSSDDDGDYSWSRPVGSDGTSSLTSRDKIAVDPYSESLSLAAFRGDEAALCQLLEAGANPNSTQLPSNLVPALYEATLAGHESIVRVLIDYGASVDGIVIGGCKNGTSRLLLAAMRRRSLEIARLLLSRLSNTSLSEVNVLDECPVQDRWIIAKNLLDCGLSAEYLVEQAQSVSDLDERLLCVLVDACSDPKPLEELLIRRGHEKLVLDTKDQVLSNRRLIGAVHRGSSQESKQEIAAGADPSWALSTSLRLQQPDLARYLLEQGADPRFLSIGGDLAGEIGNDKLLAMLVQSVHCDDKQLLDVLLDQGADVNSIAPESGESILVEAIRAKNYDCVEHLLGHGALANGLGRQVTTPLAAAMQTHQSGIVSLLLKHGASYSKHSDGSMISSDFAGLIEPGSAVEGHITGSSSTLPGDPRNEDELRQNADRLTLRSSITCLFREYETPEKALFYATRKGKVGLIQNILEYASEANGSCKVVPRQVLGLDDLHDGSTCLMEAVRNGHIRIAKTLLQYGADVNTMSPCETALSVATKSGTDSAICLLLQHGADLHVAALMLRIDPAKTAGTGAIKRLSSVAKRYQEDVGLQNMETKREFVLLYTAFLREHEHMRRAASFTNIDVSRHADSSEDGKAFDSTIKLDISKRWAYNFELNSRRAWAIGQATLKGLCRRVLPQDLNQTLLFLALAKSMSHVLRSEGKHTSTKEFEEDVERWQLLFNDKREMQLAFGEAVKSFWNIKIARTDPGLLQPSAQDLDRFQAMALRVMQHAEQFHKSKGTGDLGLMSIRASWKLRQQENITQPLKDAPPDSDSLMDPRYKDIPSERTCHQADDDDFDLLINDPVPEETPKHWLLEPRDMVLTILMAGTIFTTVIGFFLVVGHSPLVPGNHGRNQSGDILLSVQQESLKVIAATILIETVPSIISSDKRFDEAVLEAVRKQTNEAIETGQINSSPGLANFFIREIEYKFTGLGKALAVSCDRRRYFNVMQNAYSTLQAFLGLPITPLSPDLLKQLPSESRNIQWGRKRAANDPGEGERSAKAARISSHVAHSSDDSSSTASSSEPFVVSTTGKKTFCVDCNRDFKTTSNYGKHRNGPLHNNKRYPCVYNCGKDFLRNDIRLKHEVKAHQGIMATNPRLPGLVSS